MRVRIRWSRPQRRDSGASTSSVLVAPEEMTVPPMAATPNIDRVVLSLTPTPGVKNEPEPTSVPEPEAEQPETGIIGKLMLEAFGASDPGCVRGNNEDYFLVAPLAGLYLVADGMGGAQAGEQASQLASETVWEIVNGELEGVDAAKLTGAFEEANKRVKAAAKADPTLEGMGTTMVAAVERGGELLVASVGDSRCYTFKDGHLEAVTQDQTWVNEVGRRLGLDEETLKTHPMRHVLTMAIGVSEQLRVNTYTLHPAPGTQVLLCSDGLHGVVPEDEVRGVLAQPGTSEQRCKKLIGMARDRGGPDNITVVLLESVEKTAATIL